MNEMKNSIQRKVYFDIAKILMMLVVVYGHSGADVGPLKFFQSFFMPLFFIISGYFYRPKLLSLVIQKMAKTLLLPMYLSGIVGTLLAFVVGQISNVTPFEDFFRYIWGMLLGPVGDFRGASIHVLWFFGALFWGRITLEILFRFFSELQILTISIFAYVMVQRLMFFADIQSWFYILHGIDCLPFLCVGILCRKYEIFEKKVPLLLILSFFVASWYNLPQVSMDGPSFGNGILDIVQSSLLSIVTIIFIKRVCEVKFETAQRCVMILSNIGTHTLLLYSIEAVLFVGHFNFVCDRLSVHFAPYSVIGWNLWHVVPRFVVVSSVAYFCISITKCFKNV